jgi:hypothetical protein
MDDADVKILNDNSLKFERNLERREVVSILVQAEVLTDGDLIDLQVRQLYANLCKLFKATPAQIQRESTAVANTENEAQNGY